MWAALLPLLAKLGIGAAASGAAAPAAAGAAGAGAGAAGAGAAGLTAGAGIPALPTLGAGGAAAPAGGVAGAAGGALGGMSGFQKAMLGSNIMGGLMNRPKPAPMQAPQVGTGGGFSNALSALNRSY